MKKIISVLLFLTIVFLQTSFASPNKNTFRKTSWGMSLEQVMKTENLKIRMKSKNYIEYEKETLNGFNILVTYLFKENKLQVASYTIIDNKKDFYFYFSSLLSKKYGIPNKSIETSFYLNSIVKKLDNREINSFSTWSTDETKIIIARMPKNNKTKGVGGIMYFSNKLYDSLKTKIMKVKPEEKDILNNL